MKKLIFFIILLIIAVGVAYNYYVVNPLSFKNLNLPFIKKQETIAIKSAAFVEGGSIPAKYTCKAENVSPPLFFSSIPPETRSLVLIVEDPSAPKKNFTHWIVFDMDPYINGLSENSVPDGAVEGNNDLVSPHYTGPCPVSGVHKYTFKLYALDSMLGLDKGVEKEEILQKMNEHIIDQGTLTAFY